MIMPQYIVRFFKGLSRSAHLQWLATLLLFPIVAWWGGEPDMTDRPLTRTEGRIADVRNLRHGYELVLQSYANPKESEGLSINEGRTAVGDHGLIRYNQKFRGERYGNSVANCWVGDQQVCFSKCTSDLQCKERQEATNRLVLPWGVGLTLFGYLFTLTWLACGGKIGTEPKSPKDSP